MADLLWARKGNYLRFGTSSFSSEDWVGVFYPKGTKPAAFLSHYAKRYDTVEIDASYYRTPDAGTVARWADVTPEGFLFSLKFPKSIVHGGKGALPDGSVILDPEATYRERDRFLDVSLSLGAKRGPLLLQFPYLSRKVFASSSQFVDRLDKFLGDLPGDPSYAVEIRNKSWLSEPLFDSCRRHGVCLVMSDQAWMPRPWELPKGRQEVTSNFAYVRLIGDRKEIEAKTDTWNQVVMDREPLLALWADYLQELVASRVPTLVYINNHYSGFAPATVERLKQLYDERKREE